MSEQFLKSGQIHPHVIFQFIFLNLALCSCISAAFCTRLQVTSNPGRATPFSIKTSLLLHKSSQLLKIIVELAKITVSS